MNTRNLSRFTHSQQTLITHLQHLQYFIPSPMIQFPLKLTIQLQALFIYPHYQLLYKHIQKYFRLSSRSNHAAYHTDSSIQVCGWECCCRQAGQVEAKAKKALSTEEQSVDGSRVESRRVNWRNCRQPCRQGKTSHASSLTPEGCYLQTWGWSNFKST